MQSWLRRKTSSSGGVSPLLGKDKKKDDRDLLNLTPLERVLYDTGKNEQPVQDDGNDKYFGLENFGNTCYANSILQSLYFSEPFREELINYPSRAPIDSVLNGPDGQPRPTVKVTLQTPPAQSKPKNPASPATARTPTKPEDKSSAEYKKKQALQKGPVIPMDYDNSSHYGMSESLFTSLKDMFEAIIANRARNGVIRPSKLVEALKRERTEFNTGQHQDAHEFLNLLLNSVIDTVEAEAKKTWQALKSNGFADVHASTPNRHVVSPAKANTSSTLWVHDLFQGTLTSETVCLTCEKISQRDEPFIDLSVDIEQFSSVNACLQQFSEEEMLSERNKFSCDNCGYTESQKRMKIKRLPRILALHLKRFKAVESGPGGWSLQKSHHRVSYPFHLRLFNTTDDADEPDKIYELYAIVVHIGAGPYQGHYVSVVKTKEMGWVLFDDELVEPVKREFVQNFYGDRPGQASAYVLFYQETTQEKIIAEQAREGTTPAVPPRTPGGPISLKSPQLKTSGIPIGLGLSSPLTNGTTPDAIVEDKVQEEMQARPQLTHAKTAIYDPAPIASSGPSLSNLPPLNHARTNTEALSNGAPATPLATPPVKTGFLGRMRRPSKSGKRSNFLASLDMTKEGKKQENQAVAGEEASTNGVVDTTGEETPKPFANGRPESSETLPPPTPDIPQQTDAGQGDGQASTSGSLGRKRFLSLSIRRKASEKANDLRKSASRANILGIGKEEKAQG